ASIRSSTPPRACSPKRACPSRSRTTRKRADRRRNACGPGLLAKRCPGPQSSEGTRSAAAAEALVAVLELLHPAGGVEDALLARVEWVRGRRDLHVDDGVGVAVLPLDRLLARGGRPGEELGAGGEVVEDDRAVLRVDVLLHS